MLIFNILIPLYDISVITPSLFVNIYTISLILASVFVTEINNGSSVNIDIVFLIENMYPFLFFPNNYYC